MNKELAGNIKKVYILNFLASFHFFSAVLIPFFTLWGGLDFTRIMVLQAISQGTILLGEAPTGVVADKLGRKVSIAIGFLLITAGAIIYASYPDFWIFVLAESLFGTGISFLSGAEEAFVYDTLKEIGREKESKRVFIRLGQIDLLGMGISAPIGSVIAHYFGVRATMLLTAIPFFLAFLIALTLKEPALHEKHDHVAYSQILKRSIKLIRSSREVRTLALDAVVVNTLTYFFIWCYQAKLMQVGFPIALFGFVHAGIIASEIITLHLVEKMERMVGGKKNYLLLSAMLPAVCYLVLGTSSNWIALIVAISLGLAFRMARGQVMINYINKFLESQTRATTLSFISMTRSLLLVFMNPAVGKSMDINLNLTFVVLGAMLLVFSLASRIEEEMLFD